jgi:uncharacterized protein (TIGR02246 family)
MGRHPSFTILVFVAGLGTGFLAGNSSLGAPRRIDTNAADLAAIEKLHQKDIQVTLSQDPKGLAELWSEDAVRFNPGNPPAVGKQAIEAENEKFRTQYPSFKVLSYSAKYKSPQIEDGLACQWGEHQSEFRLAPNTPPANWHAGAFHVLRRQNDGSWKFVTIIGQE